MSELPKTGFLRIRQILGDPKVSRLCRQAQHRPWEHRIRDDTDFERHLNYVVPEGTTYRGWTTAIRRQS